MLPEHERVDLIRALVGAHTLEIIGVPDGRVFEKNSVSAQNGARRARDPKGFPRVAELAK